MTTQVLTRRWTFETRPDDDPVWSHAVDGDATVERVGDRWELDLTATDEAQFARVDFDDNLLFAITKLRQIKFDLDIGTIPAGVSAYFGLIIANEAAIDDIATRVMVQALASNAVTLRVDDGAIDSGNVVTGWTHFGRMNCVIDLANGIKHQSPTFLSKRGKDCLQFFAGTVGQSLRRLDRLDLGLQSFSGSMQPFVRVEKASGTATAKIKLYSIEVEYLA